MIMDVTLRTIDASNLDRYGFFCYKSKPKSPGYHLKHQWLEHCLPEGLRLAIIYEGDRSAGFIEYAPGEHTWRAVEAPGCMVIHCMWVVGSGKGKGYGARLLEHVTGEARRLGKYGLAVVTSSGNWLAKKGFFLHHGFEAVDHAPPAFDLLVKRFDHGIQPAFPCDWDARRTRIPNGLVVYHSGQCPYHAMFVSSLLNAASTLQLPTQVVELTTSQQARAISPSAYGVFGVVYNGELISYRPMGGKSLREILANRHG